MSERTDEERERARMEREARRAQRAVPPASAAGAGAANGSGTRPGPTPASGEPTWIERGPAGDGAGWLDGGDGADGAPRHDGGGADGASRHDGGDGADGAPRHDGGAADGASRHDRGSAADAPASRDRGPAAPDPAVPHDGGFAADEPAWHDGARGVHDGGPTEPSPPSGQGPRRHPRAHLPRLERPHLRDRIDSARERTHARRQARAPQNGDGPPAQAPPRRRRGRFLLPVVIGLALIAIFAAWFLISLYQPGKGAGSGRASVTIPRGGSLGEIADRLGAAGVIAHPFFFKLRTRIEGHTGDLKPGVYVLQKDMPYSDVINKLSVGPARHVINVTLPEGRARTELAPLVKQAGVKGNYLRATLRSPHLSPHSYGGPRGASLEGFLFPSTYELKRGATVRALVAKQVAAFKQNFAKVGMGYARHKNLTPFDVVTIASMVEREAELPRERPLIAAVIYNRLKQGIPLGIDATIRFAVNNWTRPLRVSQLQVNSGYNTRTHQGLPPGPIGNPGLASLEAAAHPAHVNYLFYVVKPCGNGAHAFSSTDAQFQRDVARYNAARAKKGGNSPAKC